MEEISKLRRLYEDILEPMVWNFVESTPPPQWPFQLGSLVGNNAGLYMLNTTKVGMAFHRKTRVMRQPHTWAAGLMNWAELAAFVSQAPVDDVKALRLPGLCFHQDHNGKDGTLERLIRMQLGEMTFASVYHCATKTHGERLVQMPSPLVRMALAVPIFRPDAIDFLKGIKMYDFIFTWPTLKSSLYKMKSTSEFLAAKMRDDPPDFVKLYLAKKLVGAKFGTWEDCIKHSPREDTLDLVIQALQSATTPEEYRSALVPLQDDNYSHYVRPEDDDLAEGALEVLKQGLDSLPARHAIVIERVSFNTLRKVHRADFDDLIDLSTEIQVLPNRALSFVRAKSGREIIVTLSFFQMFGQEASVKVRIKAVQAWLTLQQYLCESGHVSLEDVVEQKEIMCSFLMGCLGLDPSQHEDEWNSNDSQEDNDEDADADEVEDGDDEDVNCDNALQDTSSKDQDECTGFRAARRLAVPSDQFAGPGSGILGVSKKLKIGWAETLYLRNGLGMDRMNELLSAHGINLRGGTSPLEPTWKCL